MKLIEFSWEWEAQVDEEDDTSRPVRVNVIVYMFNDVNTASEWRKSFADQLVALKGCDLNASCRAQLN